MQQTASGAIAVQIVPDELSNRGRSHPSTFNTYFTLFPEFQLWPAACLWQGWRDSNPQPSVLETAVLPIGTTPLKLRAIVEHQNSHSTTQILVTPTL
jgi:hypothetical protein